MSTSSKRAGYVIAAGLNGVLLYLINGRPGWAVLPFITGDMEGALPLINLSLVAGIAVNLVYVIRDSRWLVAAGGLITTGVGLGALAKLWQVFPFAFADGTPWPAVIRLLLLLGIAGSMVGLVVQLVGLARASAGRPLSGSGPPGGPAGGPGAVPVRRSAGRSAGSGGSPARRC